MRRWNRSAIIALTCALFLLMSAAAQYAAADIIILNNGDQITGTISTFDGTSLNVTTASLGSVTIAMKDVRTFSTDGPIKIVLTDGSVINQKTAAGPDGQITILPTGSLVQQNIPIGSITKINPPPVLWTGNVVVNGLLQSGNTNSDQLGASIGLTRRSDQDRIIAGAAYNFAQEHVAGVSTTTEDNWDLKGEYDDFFTKQLFGYFNTDIEKDRVQNLVLRLTPGLGLGYQWAETPDFNLNTSIGGAYVYEDYSTLPKPNENISVRLAYHVDKSFDKGTYKFFSDCQYFPSVQRESDYLILFDAGVHVALTKTMFSEFKAELDYDSAPAPGDVRLDQKLMLGVGWTF